MIKKKVIVEKETFTDEVFGDNVDYCKIYDGYGITVVFCIDNRLIVKHFKSIKELIEKYIEVYLSNDFLERIVLEEYNITETSKQNIMKGIVKKFL